MTLLPDEKNKTEKLKEPVKRPARAWRNKWLALVDWTEAATGISHVVGEEFFGTLGPWPSRDVAESKAVNWLKEYKIFADYLGAFETE